MDNVGTYFKFYLRTAIKVGQPKSLHLCLVSYLLVADPRIRRQSFLVDSNCRLEETDIKFSDLC